MAPSNSLWTPSIVINPPDGIEHRFDDLVDMSDIAVFAQAAIFKMHRIAEFDPADSIDNRGLVVGMNIEQLWIVACSACDEFCRCQPEVRGVLGRTMFAIAGRRIERTVPKFSNSHSRLQPRLVPVSGGGPIPS